MSTYFLQAVIISLSFHDTIVLSLNNSNARLTSLLLEDLPAIPICFADQYSLILAIKSLSGTLSCIVVTLSCHVPSGDKYINFLSDQSLKIRNISN